MIDAETRDRVQRVLPWLLAIAFVVALLGVVYVSMTPEEDTEAYTEFYVLGPGGEAGNYPLNLTTGETGEVIVGATNNEHRAMSYTVVLSLDEREIDSRTVTLADGETWEERFSFTPDEPGERELAISLYTEEDGNSGDEPYRSLELVISVEE